MLWRQVKAHQSQIVDYSSKIHNATWYSLTYCRAFTPYISSKVKLVEQLRDIVADYLSSQPEQPTRYSRSGRRCFKNSCLAL